MWSIAFRRSQCRQIFGMARKLEAFAVKHRFGDGIGYDRARLPLEHEIHRAFDGLRDRGHRSAVRTPGDDFARHGHRQNGKRRRKESRRGG
jgi:hypothetical protein